jgi:hypothetical protein
MNIYELFPSKWVRAADLNGHDVRVTMRALVVENIGQPPKNEDKPILYFQKTEKGLVLNKTNAMIIASIYGPDTDNWMGKPVTLYATKVRAFGAVHDVIRVRDHVQTVSAAPDPIVDVDDDLLFDDDDPDPVAAPPDDASTKPTQHTNGNGNGAQSQPTPATSDDLDPDEIDLIESWQSPPAAQAWAIKMGACTHEEHARNSFAKIVNKQFGGKLSRQNMQSVLILYYKRQREKLQANEKEKIAA